MSSALSAIPLGGFPGDGSVGDFNNNNTAAFEIPAKHDPPAFLQAAKDAGTPIKMEKGTTTLAFVYQGGVVVSVDSRATGGAYIFSQTVHKVLPITSYILGTMAGGAADCQFWMSELKRRAALYELRNGEKMSVAAASKLLANMLYGYKGMGLSIGTMISGYDHTGPAIFYVDSEGHRLKGNLFSVGSGSTHAYGILDTSYRYDMTKEEAIALGRRAIYHATYRDSGSGGLNNLYHITKDGWTFEGAVDVQQMHEEHEIRFQGLRDVKPEART